MDEAAIPILRVQNAADGRLVWAPRVPPGVGEPFRAWIPVVSIVRGDMRFFLSEHKDDASPDTLVPIRAADVASIAQELVADVKGVPGAREIDLRDPDGNRIRAGTPASPGEADPLAPPRP
jgi:hypothetical protein